MNLSLDKILCMTEGQFFERKSARIAPKDLLKELVGFANASGGILVIGVEDDRTITGFKSPGAKEPEQFLEAIHTLLKRPPLAIDDQMIAVDNAAGQPDHILVLNVEVETNRVVENHDGEAYLRVNDKTVRMNYDQRRKLEYDKGQRYFEDEEVRDSSLADVDMEIMSLFQEKMGSNNSNAQELLTSRNLMRSGHLTNAGLLLFGKDPSMYLPGARVKFLRFEGGSLRSGSDFNLVKEITITGSIPRMIQETKATVSIQLREFQYLDKATGKFQSMPEYPEFAWFEGVVNALTHRDYAQQGDYVRISMFDDHLEIFSPGKLPNIVTLENMKYTRFSRNPKIARTLSDFGWVKEINEGVRRIYSEMERSFLGKPEYSEPHGHAVLLNLRNNMLNRHLRMTDRMVSMVDSGVLDSLNEEERLVCEYAFNKGKVTVAQTAELLGRGRPYSSKLLKGLTEKAILRWHGSNPNDPVQYYSFRDKE